MIKINQLKLPIPHSEKMLEAKIDKTLALNRIFKGNAPSYSYKIIRQSIDARRKPDLFYIYIIGVYMNKSDERTFAKYNKNKDISVENEVKYVLPPVIKDNKNRKVVIIGDGPAGLFCSYILSKCGVRTIVIERGSEVDRRSKLVNEFWESGELDTECNVQFGEGGAGTFSDGKLNTLVKDKYGRNHFVLETFAQFGAKKDITYVNKPHVGTDVLKSVVKNMRQYIESLGGEFLFDTRFIGFDVKDGAIVSVNAENIKSGTKNRFSIETDTVVLAIGHSSRDTFEMLHANNVQMHSKDFAVGLRIEHKRSVIDEARYGIRNVGKMPAADYKVTNTASNGRSVYSFCMCPGGYVVNASSEKHRLAINGMSYSKRDALNSNSALIVTVSNSDFGDDHPLAGMYYQRRLEEKAYELGNGCIPAETYLEFKSGSLNECELDTCMKGRYHKADLRELLSKDMNDALIESIEKFGYTMKGFNSDDAILSGIESRTSSPVRITRNEAFESNIIGLYPCGEGAGYAGGITSAAMDGIKVAEKIMEKLNE